MTSRHAFLPAISAVIVLALAIVFPFAGCGLQLSGLAGEQDGGSPCDADGQCDDTNPCTVDACTSGSCTHAEQPDGPAPSSSQTAFDCKVVMCAQGVEKTQNDNTDIQVDAEECTFDTCTDGKAFHTAKPDGDKCTMGGEGICSGGKCSILCTTDAACNDLNPCTQDSCDVGQGVCSFTPLNGVNTPGAIQKSGDCRVQICADGKDTDSADDSDLPVTATDCDDEICTAGVPSNPSLMVDVTCGANKAKYCNGTGACVDCNSPVQCPGLDNDCQMRTCDQHVCGITFSPLHTARAVAFQNGGDCHVVVCDGAGNSATMDDVDDTDLPVDGNLCTKDICTGGAITHPFEPASTACGVNGACNATGQCGCANDSACTAPTTCGGGNPGTPTFCGCTTKTCSTLGKTCGTVTDGCFATQSCNDGTKDGSETDVDCGGGAAGSCNTTCAIAKQCSIDSDCGSGHCADGVCCNTACTGTCRACTTVKKGGGADGVCGSIALGLPDPNASTTCTGNNACDGADVCKKINGQTCTANSQCVNGSCADGVCCDTACTGTCLACSATKKGSGADGVCGNIAVNQPDSTATVTCTGNSACDGNGVCKSKNGQPCGTGISCLSASCVDTVCCGSASCPTCQTCDLNMATAGTCTNLASGTVDNNPVNACTGTNVCDGAGACKKANGQTCTLGSQCLSTNCVDGACCGSAMCPACQSCGLTGTGACSNIPSGTTDDVPANTCSGNNACNGSGACKLTNGQGCSGDTQCVSIHCLDGSCCGSASCPTCQTCGASANGTCTNLASGTTDDMPASACSGNNVCDGSGACKLTNGQTCTMGSQCLSTNCVDGACCGSSSCPTCQTCGLSADGTCSNLPNGSVDNNPINACTGANLCDGMGTCKAAAANGQPCSGDAQCMSTHCVDGACCGSATCPTCQSCGLLGDGTCSNIPAPQPDNVPTNVCAGMSACNGAGVCLLANTEPCVNNSECASGVCTGAPMKTCQ